MTASEMKLFLRQAFTDVIENMSPTEETYSTYFSKDYKQYVDGHSLNFSEFVEHMKAQKSVLKWAKVTFKYMVAEGDTIATIHQVEAEKKDGGSIVAQVNAFFRIHEQKIILCDELTYLIQGNDKDKDLGSRRS